MNLLNPFSPPDQLEDILVSDDALNLIVGREGLQRGVESEQLQEAMRHYFGLQDACGGLPPRYVFDPAALPRHLPSIFLVEQEPHPQYGHDYRYRVFGTALTVMFGENMTGKLVSDFHAPRRALRTRRILDIACEKKQVFRSAGTFITRNGLPVSGEALIMPFGEDNRVTHILACLDYDVRD